MKLNNEKIPSGKFTLKNGKEVYITYSREGHYPSRREGLRLLDEIVNYTPAYILIEEHENNKNQISEIVKKSLETSDAHKSDVDWAITASIKTNSKQIFCDLPKVEFERNVYSSFRSYSKEYALIQYVTYQVLNTISHYKFSHKVLNWGQAYKHAKKIIQDFGPEEAKNAIKRDSISKTFGKWLKMTGNTKKSIENFPASYLQAINYFGFIFPSNYKRDEYMIKKIKEYSNKGRTLVVIGSGHIRTWVENGWITKA
jgi:hypothetical protein